MIQQYRFLTMYPIASGLCPAREDESSPQMSNTGTGGSQRANMDANFMELSTTAFPFSTNTNNFQERVSSDLSPLCDEDLMSISIGRGGGCDRFRLTPNPSRSSSSAGVSGFDQGQMSGVFSRSTSVQYPTETLTELNWYFAYGSNMNVAQLIERVGDYKERRVFRLDNYTLKFNKISHGCKKMGYANIAPQAGDFVYGIGYALQEHQLQVMDRFEAGYHRNILEAWDIENKQRTNVYVYIADPEFVRDDLRPSEMYMSSILGGRGLLPKDYIEMLEATEVITVNEMSLGGPDVLAKSSNSSWSPT